MKIRTSLLISLAALVLLMGTSPTAGQLISQLEQLEIDIWPEYDQPEVLVILKGWLPPDNFTPRYVNLPLPLAATVNAVAKRDATGQLLLAAHTIVDHGDHRDVRIVADTAEVRLEYYAPLVFDGQRREYAFNWPGKLELGAMRYQVQQPFGATGLQVTPAPQATNSGFDGLTYLAAELGPKTLGEQTSIQLSYEKPTRALTVTSLQPPQQQLPTPPPVQSTSASDVVVVPPDAGSFPWLVVLPVALIGALIVGWFLQSSTKE